MIKDNNVNNYQYSIDGLRAIAIMHNFTFSSKDVFYP